jgi:hypothetical protein
VGEPVHWVDRGQVAPGRPNQLSLDVIETSCEMGEALAAKAPRGEGRGAMSRCSDSQLSPSADCFGVPGVARPG